MCAIIEGETIRHGFGQKQVAMVYRSSALRRRVGVGMMCAIIEAFLQKRSYRSPFRKANVYAFARFRFAYKHDFQKMQNSHAIQLDAPVLSQCGSKSCALGSMLGQGTMVQATPRRSGSQFDPVNLTRLRVGPIKQRSVRLSAFSCGGVGGFAPSVSFLSLKGFCDE